MKCFTNEEENRKMSYIYFPPMRNIFFGLDVSSLGLKPYEPVNKEPIVREAKELKEDKVLYETN